MSLSLSFVFGSLPFSSGTLGLPVCLWKFVSLTTFDYIVFVSLSWSFLLVPSVPSHSPLVLCACLSVSGSLLV